MYSKQVDGHVPTCFFLSSFQKFASNSLDKWKCLLRSISIQEMLFSLVSRTIQQLKYIIVYAVKPLGLFCPSGHVQFTSICSVDVLLFSVPTLSICVGKEEKLHPLLGVCCLYQKSNWKPSRNQSMSIISSHLRQIISKFSKAVPAALKH